MAGGERHGAEVARRTEKVAKLDPLIAADARHWGFAAAVAVDKIVDDRDAKAALVIEDVMSDAEMLSDAGGVVDISPGAAGACAPRGSSVVVKLQRYANDLEALLDEQRGRHRRVDPARHRYDNPMAGRVTRKIEIL
jgi:hypothetical protein